jgi:hypothetical protein
MANYVVDPAVLKPLVPSGTELDFFDNKTYLSIVGFRFIKTRVLGFTFPFHKDFEEVNLRFYVRRKIKNSWRRGVVFVSELVPKWAIAFTARTFYGEPYRALPMKHHIGVTESGVRIEYSWKRNHQWESVRATGVGPLGAIAVGSEEEFITEHYWGYNAQSREGCEFQVEHPRWNIQQCTDYELDADVSKLYGNAFVESLSYPPSSIFLAEGSPIAVRGKLPFSGKS